MTIDGDVIIEDLQDRNITCNTIWIRAGSLKAGSASTPFTHKINIKLYGNKTDPGYVFDDSLVGNKLFVITGKLSLYGVSPSTLSSRLTSIIKPGQTRLTV
jgi:G8 domain